MVEESIINKNIKVPCSCGCGFKPNKEEIFCNLCHQKIYHYSKYPMTQEEKNRYICFECEEKYNEYRY